MSRYRTKGQHKKADPVAFRLKKGPNGYNLCRYCSEEVQPPRRTFCSGERTQRKGKRINGIWTSIVQVQGYGCVHEWIIRSSPRYAREAVFDRDQGVCVLCGTKHSRKGRWEMDHIIPVVEGGGECGLDNLRSLCQPCHKTVTAELRARLKKQKVDEDSNEP